LCGRKAEHRIRYLTLLLSAAVLSGSLAPQVNASIASNDELRGTLCVRIVGLPSDTGLVTIALFDSEENYRAHSGTLHTIRLPVKERTCEWLIDDLPYGDYAIMFYHDTNGNLDFDRNALGVPNEPFGFSNNAKPRLGLPAFERVKFAVVSIFTEMTLEAQSR